VTKLGLGEGFPQKDLLFFEILNRGLQAFSFSDVCPESFWAPGEGWSFEIWLLELFWDLKFGIWSLLGPVRWVISSSIPEPNSRRPGSE
jgi:hypothetical protein